MSVFILRRFLTLIATLVGASLIIFLVLDALPGNAAQMLMGADASPDAVRALTVKLGLDIHQKLYVVVAQYDHATPRPPRRFAPQEFVPWVEELLAQRHTIHVVYEACGFVGGVRTAYVAQRPADHGAD